MQGRAKRMSGGVDTTVSQTRGKGGHGARRGNKAIRGRDAGRCEASGQEVMGPHNAEAVHQETKRKQQRDSRGYASSLLSAEEGFLQ
jgi:hypothetical protein